MVLDVGKCHTDLIQSPNGVQDTCLQSPFYLSLTPSPRTPSGEKKRRGRSTVQGYAWALSPASFSPPSLPSTGNHQPALCIMTPQPIYSSVVCESVGRVVSLASGQAREEVRGILNWVSKKREHCDRLTMLPREKFAHPPGLKQEYHGNAKP